MADDKIDAPRRFRDGRMPDIYNNARNNRNARTKRNPYMKTRRLAR